MSWKTYVMEYFCAIRVQCSDSISNEDLTMLALEVCFVVKAHGYDKVLLDLSAEPLVFRAQELSTVIDVYAETHMPTTVATAFILGSKDRPERYSKVLAAVKEYGYSAELLVGEQEVQAWLSSPTKN